MTSTEILLNPRLDRSQYEGIMSYAEELQSYRDHVWLTSSGTTAQNPNDHKLIGLSREALLASAAAVNKHLSSDSKDIWLNPLPEFHVGGLGIKMRALLSGARVIKLDKWTPPDFTQMIEREGVKLTSLVPAQVFDLVKNKIASPACLRAIVVGGGAMNEDLYHEAKALGWPVMPSYGLSECSSQVATANVDSPELKILQHVDVRVNGEGFLQLKSKALLTTYAYMSAEGIKFQDPKQEGWFTTQDRGEVRGDCLRILGRQDDFIKIGGESVMFSRLELLLEKVKLQMDEQHDCVLIPVPDERLGMVVHLVSTEKIPEVLVEAYNTQVLPFERIRKVHVVERIPRTALGKVKKGLLQIELL